MIEADQQGIIQRVFHSHRDGHIHKSDAENCRTCQKLKQIEKELRAEIEKAFPSEVHEYETDWLNDSIRIENINTKEILLGKKEQQP